MAACSAGAGAERTGLGAGGTENASGGHGLGRRQQRRLDGRQQLERRRRLDGRRHHGDGCSSSCQLEPGFKCEQKPACVPVGDACAHYVNEHLVQANGNFRVFQFLIDHYAKQYGDSPGVRKKITPVVEKWVRIVICDVVLGLRAMGSAVWTQSKIEEKLRDQEAFTMALVPRILLSHQLKREIYRDMGKPDDGDTDGAGKGASIAP